MTIDSILRSGLDGMQRGLSSAAENAAKASQATVPGSDTNLEEPLIALKLDEMQVKASAKVIKTGEELQDAVLDIVA